jgi:hypothetical protein
MKMQANLELELEKITCKNYTNHSVHEKSKKKNKRGPLMCKILKRMYALLCFAFSW